jgi:hypothetical protein
MSSETDGSVPCAMWLDMVDEEYFGLVLRTMVDPWEPFDMPPPCIKRGAIYETPLILPPSLSPSPWHHKIVRCERTLLEPDTTPPSTTACYINVHLLHLKDRALATTLNADLTSLALQKEREEEGCRRSNVGGFHSSSSSSSSSSSGADELWGVAAMQHSGLPALLSAAVLQVQTHEKYLSTIIYLNIHVDNLHEHIRAEISNPGAISARMYS